MVVLPVMVVSPVTSMVPGGVAAEGDGLRSTTKTLALPSLAFRHHKIVGEAAECDDRAIGADRRGEITYIVGGRAVGGDGDELYRARLGVVGVGFGHAIRTAGNEIGGGAGKS